MIAWVKELLAARRERELVERLKDAVEERDRRIMLLQLLTSRLREVNAELDRRITEVL